MKAKQKLPEHYKEIFKVNLQKDKKLALWLNIGAVIIAIIMIIVTNIFVPILSIFDLFLENPFAVAIRLAVLFVAYIAYIILHELVHGAAMKICGTKKVKYGFTGLYAYAGSDDYYDRKSYIFVALAPIVLWGIILGIINAMVPHNWFWVVYLIQVTNISGAAGDLYVTFKFLKMPKNILIQDSGVEMKVFSK